MLSYCTCVLKHSVIIASILIGGNPDINCVDGYFYLLYRIGSGIQKIYYIPSLLEWIGSILFPIVALYTGYTNTMGDQNDSKPSWLPKIFQRSANTSPTCTPPNEHSPLLDHSTDEGETYEIEDDDTTPARRWLSEFLLLLRGSIPVILAYALQNSLQTISVLVVGRLSPEALATAAFSYMFAMSTAWLIALGGSTALDTLASSSFTGSKSPHDLGILLQRGFFVLTIFYIPVAILWACSAPIFRMLGQEEYICVDSARFLTALIPGALGYIYFEAMKKYLQAQGTDFIITFSTSYHSF